MSRDPGVNPLNRTGLLGDLVGFPQIIGIREFTEEKTLPSEITVITLLLSINDPSSSSISNRNYLMFRASTVNTMNCSLPKITYPTLRTLLLLKLHEAICLWGDVEVLSDANRDTKPEPEVPKIELFEAKDALKRVIRNTSVATYLSPIALKLSAAYAQPLPKILRHLAESMSRSQGNSGAEQQEPMLRILRDLTVETTEAGILEFKVSDRAIATWLKFLIDTKLSFLDRGASVSTGFTEFSQSYRCLKAEGGGVKPLIPKNTQNTDSADVEILKSQFAHARCGSLLRLAPVQAIAWLTDEGRLNLTEAAERGLLSEIISVLDGLSSEQDPLKLLKGLTQAFEKCDRACRFGVDVQLKTLYLKQCRLGLVMITQALLKHLLEEKLGRVALLEL
jgi:hypothetical protein